MSEQTERAEVEARILAGRAKHGVGASEDFPGNVCHLVSPLVGALRLRDRDGETLNTEEIAWFIDRLSLVLDMARWEAEHGEAAAEARGAERALRKAAEAVEGAEGPACNQSETCHAADATLLRLRARAAARGVEGGA